MADTSREFDQWNGICCCHPPAPCVPMGGWIITGSADTIAQGQKQARLVDMTVGYCGHTGQIVSASSGVDCNSRGKVRVGDQVTGCNIGNVITGLPNYQTCETSTVTITSEPFIIHTVAKGTPVTYTEVDGGNVDDEPDIDGGLNIYPPVVGRAPTPAEIQRSADIDVSPTTIHASDSSAITVTTPPVSCLLAPEPAPDSFQLSTNVQLGDLSSNTLISKKSVVAQAGFTYQEIVCNLQGLAENILEPLIAQYGNIQVITSGFRTGSGSSQHERGQACDIQYLNFSNQQVFEVSQFIKDNLNYDQLILEYGGNKPWIHVSFNRAGNRDSSVSNKFGTRVSAGNYQWRDLLYMT